MNSFWKNKNVLITGVTGFIGGNLAKNILNFDGNIFGIIRNENPNSYLFHEGINKKIRLINGDLSDQNFLLNTITEQQIDIIFHLAAQVEVGVGLINPFLTFETNVRGTYNLMEACRIAKKSGQNIESIVVASSDKAYGEYPIDKMPYRETYPLLPKYPYDTSKACADMICNSYSIEEYGLPIIITRFANIYGPGQMNFSAIVPDSIRSALGYSIFEPRSDGSMVRDFIFSNDVCELYMLIAQELSNNPEKLSGQIFNAGSNDPIDMKSLIIKIYNKLENSKDLKVVLNKMEGKKTKGEIQHQHMSFDKVYEYFDWKPKNSIDEGIEKSVKWYRKILNK